MLEMRDIISCVKCVAGKIKKDTTQTFIFSPQKEKLRKTLSLKGKLKVNKKCSVKSVRFLILKFIRATKWAAESLPKPLYLSTKPKRF